MEKDKAKDKVELYNELIEIIIEILKELHKRFHGYGVGLEKPKSKKKMRNPKRVPKGEFIYGRRKVIKIGGSYYVSIPISWIYKNNYPESLLMIAGENLVIVSPKEENKFKLSDEILKGNYLSVNKELEVKEI